MSIKNFKNTLFLKVFILILMTIFLVFSLFSYEVTRLQKEAILDTIESKAKSMSESIIFVNSEFMIINDEIKILEFVYDFVQANEDIKQLIVSRRNGNDLIIQKNKWEIEENHNKNISSKEEKSEIKKIKYEIVFSKTQNEEVFKYSYPLYLTSVHWGWLHFELSLNEYNQRLNNMYNQFFILATIMMFILLIISYFIAKMISRPIVKLEEISEKIYNGDLSKRVEIETSDEIGKLSLTFNKMIDSLEKSQDQLKESHNKLEVRVRERTDELEKKSKQLKELNDNLENIVLEEISKRQKQEELLIQQSKLASMGEMIGNIAHQWRQPLNALGLVIQNIQLTYAMDELDDKFIEKSVDKANLLTSTMSKTIDDFRNFFKPNKEITEFSLDMAIKNSISLVGSTFDYNNINIEYKVQEDIKVIGFSNEFSQVILNILTNSKDAFIEKDILNAKVSLEINKGDKYGSILIKDNAGGIPENILGKVFEPYFTTKEEGKGTGIGLYMSKIIIENNMHGKLYVSNTEVGAQFIVSIPLSK
ncbi:HAMP domain-containing protein [Poseidonibacter lekithochrous]|uniref:ATP-binding protein n=1 Tax=Poseidonibacter TaxID=2321187 RepID=UPI001C080BA4|nr:MULTISPECIES: ATP-binding protein [Poseidonibacter]MBU3015315.1 HAMP domain-containing protein [Poseidonibacter lekithochrous]MDO6828612.1 ATP-binding protein [Poseidonibacter sp. 1_MG-2023]